jgi:hypothetical protein
MELHNSNPKRAEDHDFDIWKLQRRWDNILVKDYVRNGTPVWKNQGTYKNPDRVNKLNKKQRREVRQFLKEFNTLTNAS